MLNDRTVLVVYDYDLFKMRSGVAGWRACFRICPTTSA